MKLLSKTIRAYLIFSVAILLIAIPVFDVVIQQIISKDVDEGLVAQKEELIGKLDKIIPLDPFDWLDAFEPDIRLTPLQVFRQYDTLYTAMQFDQKSQKNIPYRILESNVLVNNIPYDIQLKNSLLNNKDLIKSIVLVQALLMMLITAGLLLINRTLSKRIWKPFYQTLQKLKGYKIESEERLHFEKTQTDEFSDLNNTISALTQRNMQVYQSQKEFTENAAHEMQSPLAVMQGKMELLMQTSPLSKEQADLISDLADAGKRMNRLNKSLLLLAKIDANQFSEKEQVDITDMLNRTILMYKNAVFQKEIRLEKNGSGDVFLQVNKPLMEILLGNLLTNAIRHNNHSGYINVSISKKKLLVQNTGKLSAIEANKLFKRFQKQSSDINSIGLGLEIVKKICDLSGFQINYSFGEGLHTFSIQF